MKLRKENYRNKPPRVFCEFTEKEVEEIERIFYIACRDNEGFYGTGDETIDKEVLILRKWAKRLGWKCRC